MRLRESFQEADKVPKEKVTFSGTIAVKSTIISILYYEGQETIPNKKFTELFMLLISSEWFAVHVFSWLEIKEIKYLDSATCNHQNRYFWLEQLKKVELNISLDHSKYDHANYQALLYWIAMKGLKVRELNMNIGDNFQIVHILEAFIKIISKNNPNMKKVVLQNCKLTDVSLANISNNCPNIECLLFEEINSSSVVLKSIKCHQLKSFAISNLVYFLSDSDSDTTHERFKSILMNNPKLENFNATNVITDCDIFEIFGKHCPCLRSLEIWLNYGEDIFPLKVLDAHINIFTQGCHHLKSFSTNAHRFSYSKLFQCFATNNPYLEKIEISTNDVWDDDSEMPQRVEWISACLLEGLCKGCSLLTEFSCSDLGLSTQGLSSFPIFCAHIETINLERCAVLEDGCKLVEGKVSNLKNLLLCSMVSLTDNGLANIVKSCGCNLKVIRIEFCSQLSDFSLKHIAEHCLNLVRIVVMEESFKSFTVEAIWELFHSCKKLTDISLIVNDAYFYPERLAEALKERNLHFRNI